MNATKCLGQKRKRGLSEYSFSSTNLDRHLALDLHLLDVSELIF